MSDDWNVIFAYTRKEAIADGVLVDVTETAKEAGIRFPVAITGTAYGKYVTVPEGVTGQDERGRLWDILWMLRDAVRRSRWEASTILYSLLVQNDEGEPKPVTLKAVCGPSDDASPCITVMLPDED